MHNKSITQLAEGLRAGDFSSVELTRHYLQRINRLDEGLNSFITVTEEQALAQAESADKLLAAGEGGVLTGIPIAHKDIFCTQGVRTSCGSRMLDNFISPYDATVVERLAGAGVVMLGKTNMDEFAMGSSNETSYYGAVKNPWNRHKVLPVARLQPWLHVCVQLQPARIRADRFASLPPCAASRASNQPMGVFRATA